MIRKQKQQKIGNGKKQKTSIEKKQKQKTGIEKKQKQKTRKKKTQKTGSEKKQNQWKSLDPLVELTTLGLESPLYMPEVFKNRIENLGGTDIKLVM